MTSLFGSKPTPEFVLHFLGESTPKPKSMTRQEAAVYLGISPNYVSILTGNTARGNRISKPYTEEGLDQYLESKWRSDKYYR